MATQVIDSCHVPRHGTLLLRYTATRRSIAVTSSSDPDELANICIWSVDANDWFVAAERWKQTPKAERRPEDRPLMKSLVEQAAAASAFRPILLLRLDRIDISEGRSKALERLLQAVDNAGGLVIGSSNLAEEELLRRLPFMRRCLDGESWDFFADVS